MKKTQAAAIAEPGEIMMKRIVWNTVRDYMICMQDTTGNLHRLAAVGVEYPSKTNNKQFDEESSNWVGSYFSPVVFGETGKITNNPSTFLSAVPTSIDGIPFERVFKSVIKKVVKSLDGNVSAFNLKDGNGNNITVLNSCYYKTGFSYRLRPRIQVSAAEYADLITKWDSSGAINTGLAAKLDTISHIQEYEPEKEFATPVFPESYYFPIKVEAAPGNPDPNNPYVIIATRATMIIDYYWR